MTVTILMATRGGKHWDRNLSTSMDQSIPANQVIIVFDRKTTTRERAALQQRWPDVQFLFNSHNIGLTKSLNAGLKKATGEYIFRVDDDDIYRADRIEKQLSCFKKTGADFICSWAEGFTESPPAKRYLIACPTNDQDIKAGLNKRNILIHPSLAMTRSAITTLGGYDETYIYAQDYALYLTGVRVGFSFATVPEPLVQRSYSGKSISTRNRRQQLMYSCAAKIAHHAEMDDRSGFLRSLARYAVLAIMPNSIRQWRRKLFSMIGRGV